MIVFDGFKIIGLFIMIGLLGLCVIMFLVERIVYLFTKWQDKYHGKDDE